MMKESFAVVVRFALIGSMLACVLMWQPFLDWAVAAPTRDQRLHAAASLGECRAVASLIHGGANVNARDLTGATALMGAARSGDIEMVRTLIERGAEVNVVDLSGGTPVMYAACFDQTQVVRFLLAHGADPARHRVPQISATRITAMNVREPRG